MQPPPGTPILPETFGSSKLFNVEQQDLSQATTRPQAVPALSWSSLQQSRTEARLVMIYRITHGTLAIMIPVAEYLHPAPVICTIEAPANATCYHSAELVCTFTHSSPQESALGINCQSMTPPPRPWNLSRLLESFKAGLADLY